jgi:hypothetical protein
MCSVDTRRSWVSRFWVVVGGYRCPISFSFIDQSSKVNSRHHVGRFGFRKAMGCVVRSKPSWDSVVLGGWKCEKAELASQESENVQDKRGQGVGTNIISSWLLKADVIEA